MVTRVFPFKRTSRNNQPVTDLPEDLITVFCWLCTRECACPKVAVPLKPWESAHNEVRTAINIEDLNLREFRGYRIAGRAVCSGCYHSELGTPQPEMNHRTEPQPAVPDGEGEVV